MPWGRKTVSCDCVGDNVRRRKYPIKTIDRNPNEPYKWRCACGKPAFVDVGEGKENRYPCKECYESKRSTRPD